MVLHCRPQAKMVTHRLDHPDVILNIPMRKDLLGAWAQNVIQAQALAWKLGAKLFIPEDLSDISDFTNQGMFKDKSEGERYSTVSVDLSSDRAMRDRHEFLVWSGINELIVQALPKNAVTLNFEDVHHQDSYKWNKDKAIIIENANTYSIPVRDLFNRDVLDKFSNLMLQASHGNRISKPLDEKSPLVAIHYRGGEICDMKERHIPSRDYAQLLIDLKNTYPTARV